jgi:hypothetical protein
VNVRVHLLIEALYNIMYVIPTSKKIQKDSTNVPDVVGFSNTAFS